MRLTELFPGKANIDNTAQTTQTKQYARTADMNRQLHALVPGQTIRGEIVGRNGSEVQIRLAEDMVLNARIDQSINLEMGKNLTFEVKNNGVTLTLSPLFTNVSADVNVLKALDMAGLPVNETSVTMTEQLMEAGLPVNRTTLLQVYREINAFPDGEVSDVVNLHKLQMPVNEANMSQMASYRNLTYQLTSAMDMVLELVPQAVEGMLEEGNTQAAVNVYRELFAAIQDEAEATALLEKPTDAIEDSPNMVQGAVQETTVKNADASLNGENVADTVLHEMNKGEAPEQAESAIRMLPAAEEYPVPEDTRQKITEQLSQVLDRLHMTPAERQTYTEQLQTFAQGNAGVTELFEMSGRLLQTAGHSGQELTVLREFFGQQSFREVLTEQLKNLWTIRPEEVETPEKVSELYRRLDRQLNSLTRTLEAGGQAESGACKAASAMSQNIDFLQQLNQMYAYVQLPLHLQQGRAHGDLYVYANRKGLASADGQVSALLHLDMEHLGPVDVYVTLQNTKVSTKFYVRDDEMLDFLEEHMEVLTARLKKRGYDCNFSMTARGEGEENLQDRGLRPVLEQNRGILLSQYAFDVRT